MNLEEFEKKILVSAAAVRARGVLIEARAWGALVPHPSSLYGTIKKTNAAYCCALGAIALEDPTEPNPDERVFAYMSRITGVDGFDLKAFVNGFDAEPMILVDGLPDHLLDTWNRDHPWYKLGQKMFHELVIKNDPGGM